MGRGSEALASFSHPSLVTIFAAGILKQETTPFVAMEFLEGESLAEVLKRRGPLAWRAALRIARDVAAALDVIHTRGIVHLDLKPANVFMTATGIKVLDFGLSRREGSRPRPVVGRPRADDLSLATAVFYDGAPDGSNEAYAATQAASASRAAVAGTPGFVAPEVLERREPTSAADAYAHGATIVQLITGRLPHQVPDEPTEFSNPATVQSWWLDLREATLRGSLRDLEREGLPKGVETLARRLLAVDREARASPPGSLFRQVDEVWSRPFGLPERPYPGLEAFDSAREGTLFGRDAEIKRITRDLTFETALVIEGPRGSGKTSLVLAGVVPELAKTRADDKDDWRLVLLDPRQKPRVREVLAAMTPPVREKKAPTLALSATVSANAVGPVPDASAADVSLKANEPASPTDETETSPEAPPATLPATELAAVIAAIQQSDIGIAVVIDPLEALLDLAEPERAPIVELLQILGHTPRGKGVRVVGVIDAHLSAEVMETCGFDAAIRGAIRYVDQPSAADALDIALGPARLAGVDCEEPDAILRDVESALRAPGLLPFVAMALAKFWDDGAKTNARSGKHYRELGGATGALYRHVDEVAGRGGRDRREETMQILLGLSSTEGKAIEKTVARLGAEQGDAERTTRLVGELTSAYLVRFRGDRVTLVDERLSAWPPLETARLGAMDRLLLLERLREAADAWERAGQRAEYLQTGSLLRELDAHGALRGMSPIEAEFVRACRKAVRRRRIGLSVAIAAALALVTGLYVGENALEERRAAAMRSAERAKKEAYLESIVAKANRSSDHRYEKIALLCEAIEKGATDPSLPVELFEAASGLAPARYLTLDNVRDADLHWDNRWVVGKGRVGSLVAIDLEPPKGEIDVVEESAIGAHMESGAGLVRKPHVIEVMPTAEPTVQVAPFAFDTTVVTRSSVGAIRVVRLREDGDVVLAAAPPIACHGDVVTASAAPAIACTTDTGFAVWDMRTGEVRAQRFASTGVTISSDGHRVAAWSDRSVLFLDVPTGTVGSYDAPSTVALARFSPKEPLVAVVHAGSFEIVDARDSHVVFHRDVDAGAGRRVPPPEAIRWDAGGLDLSLCDLYGDADSYYLRKGGRTSSDPAPRVGCDDRAENAPRLVRDRPAFGPLADKAAGEHLSGGGFKLTGDRYITRTMAMFAAHDDALERTLSFVERRADGTPEGRSRGETFVDVVRAGDVVAVEGIDGVALLSAADGERKSAVEHAHLLGACSDGRPIGYIAEGASYRVFDVRSNIDLGTVKREPGIVVGLAPTCDKLYTQKLDGTLVATKLATGEPKDVIKLGGFVFDRKPAVARADDSSTHPGLLVAVSGGPIVRIDAVDDSARIVGKAVPYASAIADGPEPLEALFADATGVMIARRDGQVERVLQSSGARVWEDIAVSKNRDALLLAAPDQLSVLSFSLGEVVFSSGRDEVTRFVPWDDEGSVLAFSPHLEGVTRALVIPGGPTLSAKVGVLASNLRVKDGHIILKE